jgi:hypothetical protein
MRIRRLMAASVLLVVTLIGCRTFSSHSSTSAGTIPSSSHLVLTISGDNVSGDFRNDGPGELVTVLDGNEEQVLKPGDVLHVEVPSRAQLQVWNRSGQISSYVFSSSSPSVNTSQVLRTIR